jgi:hypothetical protein
MIRISKTTQKVVDLKWFTKEEMDINYKGTEIDSFVIIPGVTQYQHIYSSKNWLIFDSKTSYIAVQFTSEADLERYFIQLMREIKINQITNVSVDVDTKK